MKNMLAVMCSALALTGCKVDLDTTINVDDLQSTEFKVVDGNLRFEVATCTNYEDSRKDSNSLIEVKDKVPKIFRNAKFIECYKQKFDSYASFSIPVGVGAITDDSKFSDTDINIASKGNVILGVAIVGDTAKRLEATEKDMMSKLNFSMSITVQGGNGKIKDTMLLSSYVSNPKVKDEPVTVEHYSNITLPATFRLSNVSIDRLLKTGFTPILVKPAFLNSCV